MPIRVKSSQRRTEWEGILVQQVLLRRQEKRIRHESWTVTPNSNDSSVVFNFLLILIKIFLKLYFTVFPFITFG